jgi:hypothetical protein
VSVAGCLTTNLSLEPGHLIFLIRSVAFSLLDDILQKEPIAAHTIIHFLLLID